LKTFGTWGAASSFSLGGILGCIAGGVTLFPPFSFGVGALIVAVAIGALLGSVFHVTNSFVGATNTALKNTQTNTVTGKVITGAAVASYAFLSGIAVLDTVAIRAPDAYSDGYKDGISTLEAQSIDETEKTSSPAKSKSKSKSKSNNNSSTSSSPAKSPKKSFPTLYADKNYNCRSGPGKSYGHVADIYSGTSYRIIRVATNGWYEIAIKFPNTSHRTCWIGGGNVSGDISKLPYVEPPPLPQTATDGSSESQNYMDIWKYIGPHWVGEYTSCKTIASYYWRSTPSSGGKNDYSTDINNDGVYDYRVDITRVQYFCPSIGTSMFHK